MTKEGKSMIKGIITPMVSLFDEDGNLDRPGTKKLIDKLVSDEVDGIAILGSSGEFFNFSFDEKKEFISFAAEAVAGRTKLLVGTGANNIQEVLALNKFCESHNVDGVLVVTPFYFGLNEEHLYQYYQTIAQNTRLPIIVYNYPDRTSVNIQPDLLLKLATDFPNIVGIKDTVEPITNVRKFVQTVKAKRSDFAILSGMDFNLIPNLLSGGDGIIGSLTNFAAPLFTETYRAFADKDLDRLITCQRKINQLTDLYDLTDPFILAVKEAVRITLHTDIHTSLRHYRIEPDQNTREKIKTLLSSVM